MNSEKLSETYPLLKYKTVCIGDEIDNNEYLRMMETFLVYRDTYGDTTPIKLFVNGRGGDADSALAIVDLIKLYAPIHGVLIGSGISSHGTVWAACEKRYVTNHAFLGVHQAAFPSLSLTNVADLDQSLYELNYENTMIAGILARASSAEFDIDYWLSVMHSATSAFRLISATDLVTQYGMAEFFVRG